MFTIIRERLMPLLLLLAIILPGNGYAQERTITGTVLSENGSPLPGVAVKVHKTELSTITDTSGVFSITVPGPEALLSFSALGYKYRDITVGTLPTVEVVLVKNPGALPDVLITSYAMQDRGDITGSVAVTAPQRLTVMPAGNVTNQMQGRLTGVNVIGSGQPGNTSRLRIRGFGSLLNNEPLYVVDGVPTQDIASLNPADVASLCVLKDAGAAAIYGSRASNGVIIISTKTGSKGVKVTYDMFAGTQKPGDGPAKDLLNTQEYADLQWRVYANDGTVETHPIYGSSQNPEPTLPYWAANTDWYDAITEPAGIQNHDLTLSGGTDKGTYFVGMGYFKQEGIIIHTHAERFSARFNSDWTFLDDRLKVGERLTMAYQSSLGVSNNSESSPIHMGPYRSQSIIPVYWRGDPFQGLTHLFMEGDYGGTGIAPRLGNNTNAYADLTRDKDDQFHNIRMIGSAYAEIRLLEGLTFRTTAGGTWNNGYGVNYTYATYERSENISNPSLVENAYWGSDWVWTNLLTLSRTFGKHKILAFAGYEVLKYGIGRDMDAMRTGYFSDAVDYRTLTNGAVISAANSNFYTPTQMASIFVRADYALMDRYLLSATVRRDGSSLFPKSDQYGVFPSVSAGWRISRESFMSGISLINELKIRGSYGTLGNQFALSPMNTSYIFASSPDASYYDLNGTGNSSLPGFYALRLGNPDATWETNTTTNIGFDARLLKNTIGIVFDWYQKETRDLLFLPDLPESVGNAAAPFMNVAAMMNSGVDLELSYQNLWGNFGFSASMQFTTYNNEITKLIEGAEYFDSGNLRIGTAVRNQEGHPLSSFYGYQVMGLFQSQTEIDNAPMQDGAEPGFFRFANHDTSSVEYFPGRVQYISPADRTFIGNPNPKYTYGLDLSFTYRCFDLGIFLYGSKGNDIFNYNKWWTDFWPSFQGQKSNDLLYNSWAPFSTGASTPKASNKSNFSTNTQVCSYYIEDGSYLRLKSLQLGFTVPPRHLNKTGIKSLRVYLQGVNLFTITDYSGLDPELGGNDWSFGIDYGNYPSAKQFLFGFNLIL
jgi:TonB-dependent starch-binding outer membrane protein SusC